MNQRNKKENINDRKIEEAIEKDKQQSEFAQVKEEDCGGIGDS